MEELVKAAANGDSQRVEELLLKEDANVSCQVTVTDNSPFQDFPHPDDHTTQSNVTIVDSHF